MELTDLIRSRKLSLLVSLPANDPDLALAAVEGGADALKVHINVDHRASGTHFGSVSSEGPALARILTAAGNRPVGLVAGGSAAIPTSEITGAMALGFRTFSLYAHHMPAAWFSLADATFMLAPDYTYGLTEIEALGRLPFALLEASVIHPEGYGQPLTARDLALYRAIAGRVPQPVVVPSQRRLVPEDLPALAATGVRAVMIGAVVTGHTADSIYQATAAFRRAVEQV